MTNIKLTRREILSATAIACAATLSPSQLFAQSLPLIQKTIPSTGDMIPPIGIGTNRYGAGVDNNERIALVATLKKFAELGGKLIDTAPIYENSEVVLGGLIEELGIRDQLFLASKTDMRGQAVGKDSFIGSYDRLKIEKAELLQVHNLFNARNELAVLREWQAEGRVRHIGVTTSQVNQFAELETLMLEESMDFIQLNYSLGDREAAKRLLPLAADQGIAVLVNLPFGRGRLFTATEGQTLPDWASEFDCDSWGQFFLKYIISHPSVTAAIPGTRKEHHAVDNFGAAFGKLPDADLRRRQEQFFDQLPA